MDNKNIELEEMKNQIELLRKKLDDQEIVSRKLIKNSMNTNFSDLHRIFVILCICCACAAPSFYRMLNEWEFSSGFRIATCVVICLALCMIIVKMVVIRSCRRATDMDLVSANLRVRQLRVFFVRVKYIGIPVVSVWIGWFVKEALTLGGSAVYVGIGALAGGIVGVILGLRINYRIISGADRVLEEIRSLQEA